MPESLTLHQLFRLTGLLDAFSEATFRKVLSKCIDEGPKHVILDLSQIDFVDSSGLGALVQLVKKAQTLEGTLQIVSNPRVTQTVKRQGCLTPQWIELAIR
ncbi:MAG: anti-sigma factor antagonist [Oscillatoriales cyanobacterium]|nr:MAG: anti-sigma factor antagonist [Oscillatoriales cyanobacterium]